MYVSRSLTETKFDYVHIKKQFLAVAFLMERFETYTYGRRVVVESDHMTLEIIHKKNVHSARKRL